LRRGEDEWEKVKGKRKVKWEGSGREGGGNGMEVYEEEEVDY
jgi:hypothetical protein